MKLPSLKSPKFPSGIRRLLEPPDHIFANLTATEALHLRVLHTVFGLATLLVLLQILYSGLLHPIFEGSRLPKTFWPVNLPIVGVLLTGFVLVRRGRIGLGADLVLLGLGLLIVVSSHFAVAGENPADFYVDRVRYFPLLVVAGALFAAPWVLATTWFIAVSWPLAYWKLYCQDLDPLLDRMVLQSISETLIISTLSAVVAVAFRILSRRALNLALTESIRHRELAEQLEFKVMERTTQLESAMQRAKAASVAKSQFLATMSHEIRTPLVGMIGMAELLALDSKDPVCRDRSVVLLTSSGHLLSLLDEILEAARVEAGQIRLEPERFEPARLFRDLMELFAPLAASRGVCLTSEISDDFSGTRLLGDVVRVRQILSNILSNALKFTDAGSVTLSLDLSRVDEDHVMLVGEVRDTGPGLDPDTLERIWKPFEQAEDSIARRHGGTGLGLAISRDLAHLMGGSLTATSVPGQGSTFRFEAVFPDTSDQPPEPSDVIPALKCMEPAHILVVDDNPVNRHIVHAMLIRLGQNPVVVENGMEALDLLQTEAFDLVLLDLHMPVLDGKTTKVRLNSWRNDPSPAKRRASAVPVVALTADAFEMTRRECLELGMVDVLAKPFRMAELSSLLALHLPPRE